MATEFHWVMTAELGSWGGTDTGVITAESDETRHDLFCRVCARFIGELRKEAAKQGDELPSDGELQIEFFDLVPNKLPA